MCGIVGFAGLGDEADLRAMTRSLAHRGPDGEGFFVDESARVYLGHRRLAIIDIEGGGQPMWNEEGNICVVFNGEIYNHVELRRELTGCGHRFLTDHSDTEVLVHGYEEWGEALPLRLNGMFAFCVYDKRQARLFLARDRFGKKPLYYHQGAGLFAFSSELRTLCLHGEITPVLEKRSLRKFFSYGFLPAPNTIYRDTFKLPGGWCMSVDVHAGRVEAGSYWRFRVDPVADVPAGAEEEWAGELRRLLSQAVKRRLMSDVPLGIFLSGGIDSSAVLRFAAEHVPARDLQTFSIGFQEPSFDESGYARDMAAVIGSTHHEEVLSIDRARELLPEVLGRLDDPIGDPSILPTCLLSAFARRHVTVALGGDGGDEMFAGYDPFRALGPACAYSRWVPGAFHLLLRRLAGRLPVSTANIGLGFKVRKSLAGLSYPTRLWNPVWMGAVEPQEIEEVFDESSDAEDIYSEAIAVWEGAASEHIVDRSLEFFAVFYLQEEVLMKVDRASMMSSLEVRAPFLDNDLVEFTRRLPRTFKFRNGTGKYLLKKALSGYLPDRILHRKKKGFGIPLTAWLREMPLADEPDAVPGLNPGAVARRWREHIEGKADHRLFLWCWLSLYHHLAASRPRASVR